MKKLVTAGLVAAASAFAAPAMAVPVAANGTVCESLSPSNWTPSSFGGCDVTFNDLSNNAPGQSLEFAGDATVYGYVADADGTGPFYPDYAQMTFARDSIVTLTLYNSHPAFDALVSFGGIQQTVSASGTTSVSFMVQGGIVTPFFIDASRPTNSDTFIASDYSIIISAVPLPAGALLLLTGLGGLAIARRRASA